MKKIYNYLFVGIVTMLSMTLSSCNDDNIARDLDGIWEGKVSQNWSWRWSDYTTYQYVDIEFYTDPYYYAEGTGVEYDYTGTYTYVSCPFNFRVRNGVIYMDYRDGTRVRITNYYLSGDRFSGTFRDYYSGDYLADFSFYKVANFRHFRYSGYSLDADFEKEDSKTNKTEAEQK